MLQLIMMSEMKAKKMNYAALIFPEPIIMVTIFDCSVLSTPDSATINTKWAVDKSSSNEIEILTGFSEN